MSSRNVIPNGAEGPVRDLTSAGSTTTANGTASAAYVIGCPRQRPCCFNPILGSLTGPAP